MNGSDWNGSAASTGRGPTAWKPIKLTSAQREEIQARYAAAREEEPDLTFSGFAPRISGEYGVSASTVRRVLRGN